jgi:tagatose 1,6-diphosphate aldolase
MTTLGKYRHLMQSSTDAGHFVILAIDHRANLKSALDAAASVSLADDEFVAFKQGVMRQLLPMTSAVLVDPDYGIGRGVIDRTISGRHGLLAPLEVTDYDVHPSQRQLAWIEGWGVAQIKRAGGAGVKLLLPYHPDAADTPTKHQAVKRIIDECAEHDIPFFLEPIIYSLDPTQQLASDEKRRCVVGAAATFSAMGADVLKLEFPIDPKQEADQSVWQAACEAVTAAATVPWALLSAGVDFATFLKQAIIATQAGASGVIVGRAVWAEAVKLQGAERQTFLGGEAVTRMRDLAQVCADHATPWWENVSPPNGSVGWYLD